MALSKINTGGIEDDAITSAKIGTDVIIADDIAANAVTASELQDSAVTTAKIAPGGVTGVKIAGGAISAPLMGPASVTGPAIGPGAVGTSNIAAGAVTAPTIGPGAVTAPAIGAGAVDTSNIATGAVTAPTIGPGAVTGPAIGPAAVGTSNIAADAITQPLIGPGAVGSTELGTASVTAPKIGPGAVTNAAIGAGAVTTTELGPAAVTAPIIGPGAVGSTQLATNAVTTVKITDANITAPKIGSGAVTAPAIGTGAVTAPAIGPNAIGAPAIGPGAVGTSQLASDVSISTSGDISMGDNAKVQFGASNDLQIYHDGSNSYISDQGTGNLRIQATNFEVANAAYTKSYIVATDGAEVTLKYNNDNKLTTTSGGVTVTGTVNADGISLGDNDVLNFGASNDLQISHDGNNSLIADTGTGDLFIRGSNNIYLQNAGGTTMLRLASGAGNYLYYNGSSKLETTSAGATVTGTLSATAFSGDGSALTGIGGGITEADEWRLTSSATGSTTLTAWERVDTGNFGYLGTGMSQSSGTFTFPSTGIWLINMTGHGYNPNANSSVAEFRFEVSTNGGAGFTNCMTGHCFGIGGVYYNTGGFHIVDVTSTSNVKVRVTTSSGRSDQVYLGDTNETFTALTFVRLGDT